MTYAIFTDSEVNTLRNCIETQCDITHSEIDDHIMAAKVDMGVGEWELAGRATEIFFMYQDILKKIEKFTFDFTMFDYQLMIAPLELYIEMTVDGFENNNGIQSVYDAAAALAKIKLYLVLHLDK